MLITDVRPASAAAYPVLLGDDAPAFALAQWQPSWTRAVIVADDNTADRAAAVQRALETRGVPCLAQVVRPGEESKTRAVKARLEDAMLAAGADRKSCIVGVGGGVVLDLAGFVAGTFMRGIAHLSVATSLLAQVDAAIGGKTAINTAAGKNLIGVFHHPRAVLIDRGALTTLPEIELRNGLAEAVKHAMLWDRALFERLEGWAAGRGDGSLIPDEEVIARCVAIKAEVVAADDRDLGMRNILNFGHTVAHAIEAATKGAVPHGQAVAIGMVVEARVARDDGQLDATEHGRLVALLQALGLPVEPPCAFDEAAPFLANDKKTEGAVIRGAIPQAIGRIETVEGRWTRALELDALAKGWSA